MSARYPSETTLGWMRDIIGGSIVSVRSLGAAATTLHAVDARDRDGGVRKLILRRFHDEDRLASDRWYVPEREATVLALLDDTEVPSPRLVAADTLARICDMPALLMQRLPGRVTGRPADPAVFAGDMARALARIHEVEVPSGTWIPGYRPYHDPPSDGPRRPPPWSAATGLWERVYEILADPPPPDTPGGFIHRDYHPGQILWSAGRLSGVVDWTTGCRGPFGIDLARMGLTLALDRGVDVALEFVKAYASATGADRRHPYWDLLDAADFVVGPAPPDAPAAARFEEWVALAVADL